jgi:cyclophilin family peptidyl-prolyl cis-trans isomerase
MQRITILTALVASALLVAACGGSTADTTTTTVPAVASTTQTTVPLEVVPRTYEQFRSQPTACGADAPASVTQMQFDGPGDESLDPTTPDLAVISTSCGDITVELDPSIAPATVNSFVFLARRGYFDGTVFHRILPRFVAQGGDPTATGTGGPGYTIPDEFPPSGTVYERGTVAMANAGPGTTGSQFFVMLDDAELPPQFTIFGHVTDGFEVLDAVQDVPLGASPTSPDPVPSTPLETIYIDTVTIDG